MKPTERISVTRSGLAFNLGRPRPEDVRLEDIAHQLAAIHRWCGATLRPVSVAEHSLFVAEILERQVPGITQGVLLAALLHDAHEAYTGDILATLKPELGESYHALEGGVQRAIELHFGCAQDAALHHGTIKLADHIAAATEARDLLALGPGRDAALAHAARRGAKPVEWIDLRDRDGMDAGDWARALMDAVGVRGNVGNERRPLGRPID